MPAALMKIEKEKIKNLHSMTIWIMLGIWLASNSLVFLYTIVREAHYPYFTLIRGIFGGIFISLVLTFPLTLSCIIAFFLKRPTSLILHLLSAIMFGCGIIWAFMDTWGEYECMAGIQFAAAGWGSIFYLVPTWLFSISLNILHEKRLKKLSQESDV